MLADRVRMGTKKESGFYLYDHGQGGELWSADVQDFGSFSKKADHMYLVGTPGGAEVSVTTVNKVDITDFTSLKVNATLSSVGDFSIGLTDTRGTYTFQFKARSQVDGSGDFEVVSNLVNFSGEYYISLFMFTGEISGNVKILDVSLE